ncbi:hypothetical protein CEXT_786791 [Caerostris extrusa]|uniref:Uncharacterized protein n=1 Tax=Caerostris extrusa TaxID=172846 RepID=A0AAV4M844_CAEEX|nr:hypothetical protein CEXT_786791 [Caerostris extrusa]
MKRRLQYLQGSRSNLAQPPSATGQGDLDICKRQLSTPGGNYVSHYVVTSSPYPNFPYEKTSSTSLEPTTLKWSPTWHITPTTTSKSRAVLEFARRITLKTPWEQVAQQNGNP